MENAKENIGIFTIHAAFNDDELLESIEATCRALTDLSKSVASAIESSTHDDPLLNGVVEFVEQIKAGNDGGVDNNYRALAILVASGPPTILKLIDDIRNYRELIRQLNVIGRATAVDKKEELGKSKAPVIPITSKKGIH